MSIFSEFSNTLPNPKIDSLSYFATTNKADPNHCLSWQLWDAIQRQNCVRVLQRQVFQSFLRMLNSPEERKPRRPSVFSSRSMHMLTPKVDLNYLFSRYSSPPLGQNPDGQDAVDVAVLMQTPCRQGGMLTYLVPASMKS